MYRGPVIDVDVHHTQRSADELVAYLPPEWRDLIRGSSISVRPVTRHHPSPFGFMRLDSFGPDGTTIPGSDPQLLIDQLVDPLRIERAILSHTGGPEVAQDNPYLSAAIAAALNDWSIDRWLTGGDVRFYGALAVSSRHPEAAAKEIRRVGANPRLVEVVLVESGLGPPLGHPIYHPIYEAAAEYALPITIHVGFTYGNGNAQVSAGGPSSSLFEWYTHLNQPGMHNLTSFITHGVFEKWPGLRLVLLENGFTWVPWIASQLDAQYSQLRRETPWVKRLPSEYVRDHVRLSTQPFEPPANPKALMDILSTFDGIDNMILFSSDYPHWDADGT